MRNIKKYLPGYLIFGLIIYLTVNTLQAQNVTIQNKQFKIGTNNYNPVLMNYSVEAIRFQTSGTYYISAMHSYGDLNKFECDNDIPCYNQQILSDFNKIDSMGFNGIREVGFSPRYLNGFGLYFYFAVVNNSGDFIGYDSLALNPTDTLDTGMLTILPLFDSLLTIASRVPDTFKVIILMTGNKSTYNASEVSAWNDYLAALSAHFYTSVHNDELLAYDLMNEPAYHDISDKTKEQVCEQVSNWYDIAKTNDPNHLITLGHLGYVDIFEYDPAVLKLDFLSLHYYPELFSYENKALQSDQLLARQRTLNHLYWMKNNSPMPWIVGETGLTASANFTTADGLFGTIADQDSFARFSLQKTCDYGASGYSWWNYQDVYFNDDTGTTNFGNNFFGLLERGSGYPGSPDIKSSANEFINFTWGATGQGYVPPYYYDYNNWNYYSPNYPKTLTGVITEAVSGNPIEDAFIGAWTSYSLYNDTIGQPPHLSSTHTFSHSDGTYSLNPKYPYSYFLSSDYRFIGITAAGAKSLWPNVTIPQAPWQCDTFLVYFPFKYDLVINNETVTIDEPRNFQGWSTLTVNTIQYSTVEVDSGAVSEFKARDGVIVNGYFTASLGSDVYIYCTSTFPECKDFTNFKSMQVTNPVPGETPGRAEPEKQFEVNFIPKTGYAFLDVYPNPGNGIFTLNLRTNKDDNSLLQIHVYDITGSCVFKETINNNISSIDLSFLSKGIYYLHASTKDDSFNQKLIIK